MNKEHPIHRSSGEAPRPSHDYARINDGLTGLLEAAGQTVVEGFPEPTGFTGRTRPVSDYVYATKTLVLHPWISPRGRTEVLLHQAVMTLAGTPEKKRGKGKRVEETRRWVVEAALARRYGLPVVERDREEVAPTASERAVIDRIAGAVDGAT